MKSLFFLIHNYKMDGPLDEIFFEEILDEDVMCDHSDLCSHSSWEDGVCYVPFPYFSSVAPPAFQHIVRKFIADCDPELECHLREHLEVPLYSDELLWEWWQKDEDNCVLEVSRAPLNEKGNPHVWSGITPLEHWDAATIQDSDGNLLHLSARKQTEHPIITLTLSCWAGVRRTECKSETSMKLTKEQITLALPLLQLFSEQGRLTSQQHKQ